MISLGFPLEIFFPLKSEFFTNLKNSTFLIPATVLQVRIPPRKTNMDPENTPLEKEKHVQTTNFCDPC